MMFGRPRVKAMESPPTKKRKLISTIEEIAFDPSAREDYLTGFHKRKLQRIKHAKEEAMKRKREEKLTARKILREGRKADLEMHVEAVNSMLKRQNRTLSESSDEESPIEVEQWNGIVEDTVVDHEDEYVDEDRYTTVTVEAMDVSKDGFHKTFMHEQENQAPTTMNPVERGIPNSNAKEGQNARQEKRLRTKERPSEPKKRKKKFRYESKAERKVNRYKERSGNKAKAKARKKS